jgi:ribosomal protein L11 methyltransferase
MTEELIEIQISYNRSGYDNLIMELYQAGIENLLEEEGSLKFYLPLQEESRIEEIKGSLILKGIIPGENILWKKFENRNWNKEWEKSIQPVYISNKIIVYPSWKKDELIDPSGKLLIEIDPKMSFGTGHNETTQLMLEMMVEYIDKSCSSLLDFGSGTGILAIAAAKMGLNKIIAIDTDEDSIENALEYFDRNNVSDKIILYKNDIIEISESGFDVICANIISSVISSRIDTIYNKLNASGKLFISGILAEEAGLIKEILSKNFNIRNIRQSSEWLGVFAEKK